MPAKRKSPTVKNVPSAKEMEDWVLVALQDLGGEDEFDKIDGKVKGLLEAWGVPTKESERRIKHIRGTSLNLKTAWCRTRLKDAGFLEVSVKGRWGLTAFGETRANDISRPKLGFGPFKTSAVNRLAREARIKTDALRVLRDDGVSEEVLEKFLKLLVAAPPVPVDCDEISPDRLEVEKAAIKFIRGIEKGWHTTPPNNPGFDLYQTESGRRNGKVTVWCEVKSLSGKFSSVSLTHTEFEKAQECGDAYWLYIVENAQSDKPTLLKIQNPAGKAERFTYGSRWRNVAEK